MNKLCMTVMVALVLAGAGKTWAQQEASSPKSTPDPRPATAGTAYRLTYTVTESEGTKQIGRQRFSLTVISEAANSELRLGSKVPIATGTFGSNTPPATQFQYVDVGLNITARVREFTNGAMVFSKLEQSSVSEEDSGLGKSDPVIRQALLENTALLTAGKPVMLGSLDIPGSTRHLDIEVVLELVH